MKESKRITPVILCGGAGSRLWPASREELPKQFLPMFGGGRCLFDLTLHRISDDSLFTRPVILSAVNLCGLVRDALTRNGVSADMVLEPCRRNSGPAIAAAVELLAQSDPEALVLVLASDHLIDDGDAFRAAIRESIAVAAGGSIVTFGVAPTTAHTGYGYIQPGAAIANGIFKIERFIEKPDAARATQLLKEGCLWNSGNLLFRADVMRSEVARLAPDMASVARKAVDGSVTTPCDSGSVHALPRQVFERAPEISIDYSVLEHTTRAACKQVSYTWSDMGTWDAVWASSRKDQNGNAVQGSVSLHETRNSLVVSQVEHAAVVGLENVMVVATRDAVLVTPRDASSALPGIVAALKADPATAHLVARPAATTNGHADLSKQGIRTTEVIELGAGQSTAKLVAGNCDVHWIVLAGKLRSIVDGSEAMLETHAALHVRAGASFQLLNDGDEVARVFKLVVSSDG